MVVCVVSVVGFVWNVVVGVVSVVGCVWNVVMGVVSVSTLMTLIRTEH